MRKSHLGNPIHSANSLPDAIGHCHRNAGFIRQPPLNSPGCRMNPAFHSWNGLVFWW
jgi:hypothetical protein